MVVSSSRSSNREFRRIRPHRFRAWPVNAIDHFVLRGLLAKGMEPAHAAEPGALIRRVYFDLTGLPPPTPEELEAFVREPSSQNFQKVVDRLLGSPRYGEALGTALDGRSSFCGVAWTQQNMCAKTPGLTGITSFRALTRISRMGISSRNKLRLMWSFPRNPPPLLHSDSWQPAPWDESWLRDIRADTLDRKAAQYLDRDDMIGTVTNALLSTTVQCARCHDHKFDPISQDEYYGLQAVFAGVDRAAPFDADSRVHEKRLQLTKRRNDLKAGVQAAIPYIDDPADPRLGEKPRSATTSWKLLDPDVFTSAEGATAIKLEDHSIRFTGKPPDKDTYVLEAIADLPSITAVRLEVLDDESLPHHGPGRQDNGNLHLSEFKVESVTPDERRIVPIARTLPTSISPVGKSTRRSIAIRRLPGASIRRSAKHQCGLCFPRTASIKEWAATHLHIEPTAWRRPSHWPTPVSSDQQGLGAPPVPGPVLRVLAKPTGERTKAEKTSLANYVLLAKDEAELAALPAPQLVYAAAADFKVDGSFAPAHGCRPIHVLRRGDIGSPASRLSPEPWPASMAWKQSSNLSAPTTKGRRRAALADWVTSPKNPLTWRSIANRLWHYHFGRGIVETPSDFGRNGRGPHPELLDWLAAIRIERPQSLKPAIA